MAWQNSIYHETYAICLFSKLKKNIAKHSICTILCELPMALAKRWLKLKCWLAGLLDSSVDTWNPDSKSFEESKIENSEAGKYPEESIKKRSFCFKRLFMAAQFQCVFQHLPILCDSRMSRAKAYELRGRSKEPSKPRTKVTLWHISQILEKCWTNVTMAKAVGGLLRSQRAS